MNMITSPYGHKIIQSPDFNAQNYDDQYENIFDISAPTNSDTLILNSDSTMQHEEHIDLVDNTIIDEPNKS